MGALLWVAADQFDLEWQVMRDLFLGVVLVSGALMALAAAVALLWTALRALLRRRASEEPRD